MRDNGGILPLILRRSTILMKTGGIWHQIVTNIDITRMKMSGKLRAQIPNFNIILMKGSGSMHQKGKAQSTIRILAVGNIQNKTSNKPLHSDS